MTDTSFLSARMRACKSAHWRKDYALASTHR